VLAYNFTEIGFDKLSKRLAPSVACMGKNSKKVSLYEPVVKIRLKARTFFSLI
jgi:hypothetical protein